MFNRVSKLAGVAAIAALTACNGSGSNFQPIPPQNPPNPVLPKASGVLARIVGVGDSLTAGTQSDGTMGISYLGNPVSAFPGGLVPATQPNGFYALVYEQATGMTAAQMASPATSVLPLIAAPGNGAQLVPTVGAPFGPSQLPCSAFNAKMFSASGFSAVRANPATIPLDVGVPGISTHEALFMNHPLTGPEPLPVGTSCPGYVTIPGDPTSGAFQQVVSGESSMFTPVLGNFAGHLGSHQPLTMVNAALSLRPTLTTVWLGGNDLLKYSETHGQAPSNTPAQMQTDISSIIKKLHGVGSKVVVSNLPDVLSTAQFFQGGAVLTATLTAFLERAGVPSTIAPIAAANASANIQTTYGVSSAGYLTESGFFSTVQQVAAGVASSPPNLNVTPILDTPGHPGSGDGTQYLDDAFAGKVRALNTAYNQAIAAAASANGAPLVDIHALFVGIEAAGGVPINPPICCNLQFGGGILALDGLHPTNTGYALIANAFIATINTAYGTTMAPVNVNAIYATDPYAPH
jgi:lysophospholipase L1-like esterase